MSYEPLHHKYRPQTFADLVGQEAIARTLTNAIRSERIAPAYLFTGPRGTGKTSSARILAKSLNCKKQDKPTELPCGRCEVCTSIASGSAIDVTEIDAASNTGVDNIREIIERAQFAPAQCRYKVYAIDECHMLSSAAFNALLKTLEEPPDRVVFVLATTDPQRVLPTIISRCQRFDFRRIPLEAMVEHLGKIASEENINIAPDAIALVAQVAQGGLRDAESLLDQLSLLPEQVTVEAVWDLVGTVPEKDLLALARAIASNNPEPVIEYCRHLLDRGKEPLVVLQNLAGFYRDLLIAKTAPTRSDLVALTPQGWKQLCEFAAQLQVSQILFASQRLKDSEVQVKNTTQPRLWLEVTLLGLLPKANLQPASTTSQPSLQPEAKSQPASEQKPPVSQQGAPANQATPRSPQKETQPPSQSTAPAVPSRDRTEESPASPSIPTPVQPTASTVPATEQPSDSEPTTIWQQVLKHIQHPAAYALVSQHCYLLSLEESVAYIGISSQRLQILAQDKIPHIEAAFEAVCKSRVKVTLQTKPSRSANTAANTGASLRKDNGSDRIPNNSPPSAENVDSKQELETASSDRDDDDFSFPPNPQPPDSPTSLTQQVPIGDVLGVSSRTEVPSRSRVETDLGSYSTALQEPPISPSVREVEEGTEEVERALKELKLFFEGEFIDLNDEIAKRDTVSPTPLQPSQANVKALIEQPELDEESWEELEQIERAATDSTDSMRSRQVADSDNIQIPRGRENLLYDEDGDLAF